jgi:hypothetical protein
MSCCLACETVIDDLWRWCPECGGRLNSSLFEDSVGRCRSGEGAVDSQAGADLQRLLGLGEGLW